MPNSHRSRLSPLIVSSPKVPGAVCSFGFFVQDEDVTREQHVANAHSASLAEEFILCWRDRGGQVIDLRPRGTQQFQPPLPSPSESPLPAHRQARSSSRQRSSRKLTAISAGSGCPAGVSTR